MEGGGMEMRRRSHPALGSEVLPSAGSSTSSHQHREGGTSYKAFFTRSIIALFFILAVLVTYLNYGPSYPQAPVLGAIETSLEHRRPLDLVLNPQAHQSRSPKIKYHNWTVTSEIRRPDGVAKKVYLINGLFPGPTLESRSGDTFIIHVENALEDEGLSIHWHGLHMRNHAEYDGAIGMTQCPIPPGSTFTYTIPISGQHGTFWYHAHEQVQRADGLYGALIVHEPVDIETTVTHSYDEDRVLMIGDWYHRPAEDVLKWYMRAGSYGMEPVPDSLLINGLGAYNCSLAVPARPVDCISIFPEHSPFISTNTSKRYRYRVINTGSLAGISLRLSGASLTPITVDGGHPIDVQGPARGVGVLHPGERLDILMSWRPTNKQQYTLEIALDDDSFRYPNLALAATHIYPVIISTDSQTETANRPSQRVKPTIDIQLLKSTHLPTALPLTGDHTLVVYTTTLKLSRLSNIPHGFMNHTSHKPQSSPPFPLLSLPRSQWDSNQFVPFLPSTPEHPQTIDLVINNLDDGGHPFHLHGHDFWVLSTYAADLDTTMSYGSYNPFDRSEPPGGVVNLVNPVKKDTVFIPRRGYVVIRFLADNPGIWMLHCHLLWHQASGMAMGLHIGVNEEWVDEARANRSRELCGSTR
ncbi:hypothetical protein BU16DRAFT_614808 [Lophium mytilinum]|uniref:Multicopper oxidase n=1 Tax=Lophium mytilinum TaxID=390894 RepID=A0A6A6R3M0_9PEZI|nr:hypothetical protein BU16DRAFT_614808 [Lophium mytilinum]